MKFSSRKLDRMYPCISEYMRRELPKIRSRRKKHGGKLSTWEAFHTACGSDERPRYRRNRRASLDKAKQAINASGSAPLVRVTEASVKRNGRIKGVNAVYVRGGNLIYLDDEVAAVCEYRMQKKGTEADRARLFLESTLLHEAVHWARYMSGLRSDDLAAIEDRDNDAGGGRGKKYEPGKFFEHAAYGSNIGRSLWNDFNRLAKKARRKLGIRNVKVDGTKRSERSMPTFKRTR